MDKADEVNPEVKPRGRPKKQDPATPIGQFQIDQAKAVKQGKSQNSVVEKYYELYGTKLRICKIKRSGSVKFEYVGNTQLPDKPTQEQRKRVQELKEFVTKLQKEGRLRIKV